MDKEWIEYLKKHSVSQEKCIEDSFPENFMSGWGDSEGGRESYTIDDIDEGRLYDRITFNSIRNSIIGDEKNFVGARKETVSIISNNR